MKEALIGVQTAASRPWFIRRTMFGIFWLCQWD